MKGKQSNTIEAMLPQDPSRRDFIHVLAASTMSVSAAFLVLPVIMQMSPASDTLAAGSVDVDISQIPVGAQMQVMWQNKPVFIRHRTEKEILEAQGSDSLSMKDPQRDSDRILSNNVGEKNLQYLIVVGVCTHLGCIPIGGAPGESKGEYNGWFCPCHGSHYDISGRIRKGPATSNLAVPSYKYLSESVVRIGL